MREPVVKVRPPLAERSGVRLADLAAVWGPTFPHDRAPRVLGLFAHPDDEVFCFGGTIARCADAGAVTAIVSLTQGELGQIRDAATATRRVLGAIRVKELEESAAALGVDHVTCLDRGDGRLAKQPLEDVEWFPAGSFIIEHGEPASELFCLLSGSAAIVVESDDGGMDERATIGAGSFIGEEGLASGKPRNAHVIARDDVTCLVRAVRCPRSRPHTAVDAGVRIGRYRRPPARGQRALPNSAALVDGPR